MLYVCYIFCSLLIFSRVVISTRFVFYLKNGGDMSKKKKCVTSCRFKGYCKHKKELLKDPEIRKEYNRELLSLMVGHQVTELRENGKLTQVELGKKIGVVPHYVSVLEHGRKIASIPLLLKIAEVFGKKLSIKFT